MTKSVSRSVHIELSNDGGYQYDDETEEESFTPEYTVSAYLGRGDCVEGNSIEILVRGANTVGKLRELLSEAISELDDSLGSL